MSNKTATFFCSASNTIDPIYNKAAREVVRAACLAGYVIASGGTTKGTMKVVVDAARESGGKTLGVIPKFMDDHYNPEVDHVIWTETMAERKQILRDNSCNFLIS